MITYYARRAAEYERVYASPRWQEDLAPIRERIRAAMQHASPARIFPCTNCGMVPLSRTVALAKLQALGAGAALVRRELVS